MKKDQIINDPKLSSHEGWFVGLEEVYICGMVTGIPFPNCVLKFSLAELMLKEQGFETTNPLKLVNDLNASWQEAMKLCIAALLKCDAVFALPDWTDSKGAICEVVTAWMFGIPVFCYDTKERILVSKEIFEQYVDIVEENLLNG